MNDFALTPDLKNSILRVEYESFKALSPYLIELEGNKYGLYFKQFGNYQTVMYQSVPFHFVNKVVGPYEEDFFDYYDEIVDWFRQKLDYCNFSIIPRVDNVNLINNLVTKGFRLGGYHNFWIKGIELQDEKEIALPKDDTIREVTPEIEDDFVEVALSAFELKEDKSLAALFIDIFKSGFVTKNTYNYVYYIQHTPVGAGSLFIHNDFAFLFNGSVLSEFQGRQIQQKLVKQRINAALVNNAKYAVTTTGVDTTSGRNMERQGFKQAFIASHYIKKFNK